MSNKRADTAKAQLIKVFADCKSRFGSIPTGCTADFGKEFLGSFSKYLESKGITLRNVRLCPWVEKKNSTAFRIFGVLIDIHGFKKTLRLTLEKVNNIRNRITGKAPVDWTAQDFAKSAKRNNKKLKMQPKLRKQPVYEIGDRVRTMQKQMLGKEPFYKSYEGLRSKKHQMWSVKIFTISAKKRKGHGFVYYVNGTWRPPYELQLILGDPIILESHKVVLPSVPKVKKVQKYQPPPYNPQTRRSSRIRQKPVVNYSSFF